MPAVYEVESNVIHNTKKGADRPQRYAKPGIFVLSRSIVQEVRLVGLSTHLLLKAGYYLLYTAQAGIFLYIYLGMQIAFPFCLLLFFLRIIAKITVPATIGILCRIVSLGANSHRFQEFFALYYTAHD